MEDSKKNMGRKVLTDEELEQVSGGRVVFDITAGPSTTPVPTDPCAQWKDRGTCVEKYDNNCIWDWDKNKCVSFRLVPHT